MLFDLAKIGKLENSNIAPEWLWKIGYETPQRYHKRR